MRFEWDATHSAANRKKHGASFETAVGRSVAYAGGAERTPIDSGKRATRSLSVLRSPRRAERKDRSDDSFPMVWRERPPRGRLESDLLVRLLDTTLKEG
jgi:hypothetical protein